MFSALRQRIFLVLNIYLVTHIYIQNHQKVAVMVHSYEFIDKIAGQEDHDKYNEYAVARSFVDEFTSFKQVIPEGKIEEYPHQSVSKEYFQITVMSLSPAVKSKFIRSYTFGAETQQHVLSQNVFDVDINGMKPPFIRSLHHPVPL